MVRRTFITILHFLAAIPATAQWTQVEGVPSGESYAVISSGDTLYASIDSVVHSSEDGGLTWSSTAAVTGLTAPITALLRLPSGLLVGTLNKGIFRTTDGVHWAEHSQGLDGLGARSISAFAVRDTIVYAGTMGSGVFRTGALLASPWLPFSAGLPSNTSWTIYSLTNLEDTLWAGGGANATTYRNGPTENSWLEIPFATFSPLGTCFLAATMSGTSLHAIGSQGFHRTTDGGAHWITFDPGAGFISVAGFAQTPLGLYAFLGKIGSTYLFRLNEDDSSWSLVNVAPGSTTSMAASGTTLFAGRFDGLWKYELAPSGVDRDPIGGVPATARLEPNYPNPFNPTTRITYSIPATTGPGDGSGTSKDRSVRLAVYDLLGREVAVLVDEPQQPGRHQVDFDGTGLASGAYVYQLRSGSRMESRTMLLMK